MQINELFTKELIPYSNNPRNNDGAVDAVAASIKEFGFKVPIIIDKDNVIVAGHTRLKAALKLGLEKVPCVKADDLTEDQIKAFRLADNKVGELATWDFDKLESELEELDSLDLDFEMSDFGFDVSENRGGGTENVEEDDYDGELPEEPKAKLGDLYALGDHRLICGDSTDVNVIDKLMDGAKADMIFTDPPYNIASDSKNFAADVSKAMDDLSKSEWDMNFDIVTALNSIYTVMAEDVSVYICTSHFLAGKIWDWMKSFANYNSYCIWSKPNPMPSLSKRHWTWNTEIVCYATRGKHTFNFPKEGHALSTWTINKKNGETKHPTEKPIEVPAMAISHSSNESDIVFDAFGGSGSTLIACEQLKRKCYMCELDPHYIDVIIDRWEKFTGRKAELLNP